MAEGGEIQMTASEAHSNSEAYNLAHNLEVKMDVNESNDALDVLLQRSRSERLNELQRIQNEDRPVTGQQHRDHINHFISKNMQVREQASGKQNVPLNTINVEEHRPEAVVVEIQGLSQQHRVSNVLQTAAFRRHLENIIRGSISTVTQTRSPSSSHRPSPAPSQSPAVSHQPSPSPAPRISPSPVPDRTQENIVEPAQQRETDTESVASSSHSTSSHSSSDSSVGYNMRIQDPRGLLRSVIAPPAPPPLPAFEPQSSQEAPVTWNIVEDIQREDLVHEVSELVHRRLVTSTLEGEFRNVLEFHIGERVQSTGTDGRRVAEFIQSIPQSHQHVRNDFSNIGLPPAGADNWDNVSVTSISATAVPYTQTNLYMSRELAALKSQLQEMKSMMKVSFELQLDIQRAIRQEVAAGIAAASASGLLQPETNKETMTTPKSRPVSDTHCLICLDNHSDSVLYQCGHMCVCYPCGRHLMDRGAKCPVCRAPIRDIIRAYKCNQD